MATRSVLIGALGSFAALGCVAHTLAAERRMSCAAATGATLEQPLQSASPSAPAVSPRYEALIVFPFENASHQARLDWLGEGLAELTTERLAAAGEFVFPREDRLAALERLGLPASTRFSRATMLKIADEIDADYVIFGRYSSDGSKLTLTAQLLRVSPPNLAPLVEESGALDDLMDIHARFGWRLLNQLTSPLALSERDFLRKSPRLRLDAFELYIRGLFAVDDEQRLHDFREAARLEPAWNDPAFALGQIYVARRDCESALPWLTRVPPAYVRGQEASFAAGVCHLLRNDPARAESVFASLLERERAASSGVLALPEALNNLGVAWERLGKSTEAAVEFQRATELDADEPDYWFNLGVARLRTKDPADAVKAFREVLRRQPSDPEARALLLMALERSGRSAEAAAARQEFSKPPAPPAATGEGGDQRQAGRSAARPVALPAIKPDRMPQMARIKMRFDPAELRLYPESSAPAPAEPAGYAGAHRSHRTQHRQLHLDRGRQDLALGKLEDAQREFTEAVVLGPHDAAPHQGLSEVYRRQGRLDDAIRELRAAVASREDASTHTALARLYLQQDQPAQAREELRLALKLDPANAEARQLLDQLEGRGSGESK